MTSPHPRFLDIYHYWLGVPRKINTTRSYKTLLSAIWEKGLLIWGPSCAVAFLLIGQDIQYVAYPTTAHSVQFCVATVGTRYSSKLLVLKVQESRQTWTCRPDFSASIFCSWTFYTTELMLLHNPTPLHQVRTIIHALLFYYGSTYPA